MRAFLTVIIFGVFCLGGFSQTVSPLFARGYTVIPEPQKISLVAHDFVVDSGWRLELEKNVASHEVAVQTLRDDLATRFHLALDSKGNSVGVISLQIAPGTVPIGNAQDSGKSA
ncbi:MAG: hypothetical protein ABI164_07590, partial [Acidobacteriaceae bacterium]